MVWNLSAVDGGEMYATVSTVCRDGAADSRVEALDTRAYRRVDSRSSVVPTFGLPPENAAPFVATGTDGLYPWAAGTCGEGDHLDAFDVERRDVGPGSPPEVGRPTSNRAGSDSTGAAACNGRWSPGPAETG